MVSPKDKFVIKNPARNIPDKKQNYIPQYQVLGIEPTEYVSPPLPKNILISKGAPENPRLPRAAVRQPYAEIAPSPLGKDPLPNIGNNVEHTWSSVDGEIIDDISELDGLDPEAAMIDNNDFVSGYIESSRESVSDFSQLMDGMRNIEDHECVVFVKGIWAYSGPQNVIEEAVQAMIFGDDEICEGKPIPVEDILVLHKLPIKVGVFLG